MVFTLLLLKRCLILGTLAFRYLSALLVWFFSSSTEDPTGVALIKNPLPPCFLSWDAQSKIFKCCQLSIFTSTLKNSKSTNMHTLRDACKKVKLRFVTSTLSQWPAKAKFWLEMVSSTDIILISISKVKRLDWQRTRKTFPTKICSSLPMSSTSKIWNSSTTSKKDYEMIHLSLWNLA